MSREAVAAELPRCAPCPADITDQEFEVEPEAVEVEPEPAEEEGAPPTVEYKVVETSDVTAEELERLLNETTKEGWDFDAMQFAMRESSRRPSMVW